MTPAAEPATAIFTGASGNRLVGDVFGDGGSSVLLLHGGGQTRHTWRTTARQLARSGRIAYAIDQRGHGDSDWISDAAYAFSDYAADTRALADALAERTGERPIVVGASLGGIAALMAEGAAERDLGERVFSALVLVDVTPRVDLRGVDRIQRFMRAHAREGFGSVQEAADAVAAYLPHRPRPPSHEGLKKNLRLEADGRWRWHWDPQFLEGPRPINTNRAAVEEALMRSARHLDIPALLVRGGASEVVQEFHAREFLDLVPHAEYADIGGARHMVAGDHNDQFSTAILSFLDRLAR
jgi:pimeloyl-ACP methyl ester carboxylesterase